MKFYHVEPHSRSHPHQGSSAWVEPSNQKCLLLKLTTTAISYSGLVYSTRLGWLKAAYVNLAVYMSSLKLGYCQCKCPITLISTTNHHHLPVRCRSKVYVLRLTQCKCRYYIIYVDHYWPPAAVPQWPHWPVWSPLWILLPKGHVDWKPTFPFKAPQIFF